MTYITKHLPEVEELKKEYQNLIDEYKWNDLVYKSKFSSRTF